MDEIIYELVEKNELKLAGFGKRAFASLIDFVLLFVLINVIFMATNSYPPEELQKYIKMFSDIASVNSVQNYSTQEQEAFMVFVKKLAFFQFYTLALYFFYNTIFVNLYGATVGKFVCKIQIIDYITLDRPGFFSSMKRAFAKTLLDIFFLPTFPINLVGYAVYFYGKSKRDTNDMFAKTIVVENF